MVDLFGLAIGLWVIGGGEGDVIFEKASEFTSEGRGKLRSSVREDLVMETELWEDVLKKDLGEVHSGGGFVARAENYPLRKTMVYHDQNRIIAVGKGQISDEIHRDLWEGAGAFRRDRGQGGVGWVDVNFIGLAGSAASDEFADEGGHSWPPIILLEKGDGVEVATVSSHERLVEVLHEGVVSRFGDIKACLVVEGALVEVPVLRLRVR